MKRLGTCFGALILCLVGGTAAVAHEVRPASLELSQPDATSCRFVWKQPTMGDLAVHLVPHVSNGWLERKPDDQYASAGFLLRTWTVRPCAADLLAGSTINIEGLDNTAVDVFVRIRLQDRKPEDIILRPGSTQLSIAGGTASSAPALPSYLLLGIEHILTGPDHLLFVLGLLLLVRERWMLLKAVSAFTLAHSITLASALLAGVSLPSALVETLIALSILFLAPEILRARRGGTSLTIRYPWMAAFVFGLFHGMGFAGGLASLGFRHGELATALALFNLGVEIGQLGFIALAFALARMASSFELGERYLTVKPAAYVVGIAGAYWSCQTGAALMGMTS
jgi:hydrogenase/urease accessory protein HupE